MSRSNHPYRPQGYIPTDVDRSSRIWKPTDDNLERVHHTIESANSFRQLDTKGEVDESETLKYRKSVKDNLPRMPRVEYRMDDKDRIAIFRMNASGKYELWTPDHIRKRHEDEDEADKIIRRKEEEDAQARTFSLTLGRGLEQAV